MLQTQGKSPVAGRSRRDLDHSPLIVFYEVTRACDLVCLHCRACAQVRPDANELTPHQARLLIDRLTRFPQPPMLVLTGGDPLKRPDIYAIIEHAVASGLETAITPSATPLVTDAAVRRLRDAGISRMAVSLDGADAATHDAMRGVSGSFEHTRRIMASARSCGIPLQVNTTLTPHNFGQIERMAELLACEEIVLWSVFFVVPVGRATEELRLTAEQYEQVFSRLWQQSQRQPYVIKTTEAPHYRRFVLQHRKKGDGETGGRTSVRGPARGFLGLNDGKGVMFVSHAGLIHPSGFLPVVCGTFPFNDPVRVYQDSPIFRGLRDANRLEGKCGDCEYRHICGGSRARTYALTGNLYAEEPNCTYAPKTRRERRAESGEPRAKSRDGGPRVRSGPGQKRVAVIGGGVSGLAAAHRLRELDSSLEVALFEAGERLGGVAQTEEIPQIGPLPQGEREEDAGFLIERGPDSFITKVPWAVDLCRRLGMEDELLSTNPAHQQTFVVRGGRLRPLPPGFAVMAPTRLGPLVTSPALSVAGKLRLACEPLVPARRGNGDESLASFARRRFGREVFERLVQPLAGGIHMTAPERLSMDAAFARFADMERTHGSLVRAARREQKAKTGAGSDAGTHGRMSFFVAPRKGMQQFVQGVADKLPAGSVRCRHPVAAVRRRTDGSWSVQSGGQDGSETDSAEHGPFDAVIVAAPAKMAGRLLSDADATLAEQLYRIPYGSCLVVTLAWPRSRVAHPLDGYGFVVPRVERRSLTACTFSSMKFPGRAPRDQVLLRAYLNGASQPELFELSDTALRQLVVVELRELLGVRGSPSLVRVARWRNALPQYELGHLDRIAAIEERAARLPGLELAGNAYHGIGIPHCVHSGEQAAERVAEALRAGRTPQAAPAFAHGG